MNKHVVGGEFFIAVIGHTYVAARHERSYLLQSLAQVLNRFLFLIILSGVCLVPLTVALSRGRRATAASVSMMRGDRRLQRELDLVFCHETLCVNGGSSVPVVQAKCPARGCPRPPRAPADESTPIPTMTMARAKGGRPRTGGRAGSPRSRTVSNPDRGYDALAPRVGSLAADGLRQAGPSVLPLSGLVVLSVVQRSNGSVHQRPLTIAPAAVWCNAC